MNSRKMTRRGTRSMIAGLAVVAAMSVAMVLAAAAQGHSHHPGKLPGLHGGGHHHQGSPGHGGHLGAPGN